MIMNDFLQKSILTCQVWPRCKARQLMSIGRISGNVPHLAAGDGTVGVMSNPGLLPAAATKRLAEGEAVRRAEWTTGDGIFR